VTLAPDARAGDFRLEQWIDAHVAGKPVGRSFGRSLCSNSFDFHIRLLSLTSLSAQNYRDTEGGGGSAQQFEKCAACKAFIFG